MSVLSVASVSWSSPAPREPRLFAPLPGVRPVAVSASRAARVGAFVGAVVRSSSRSASGSVLVAVFSSRRVAARFAAVWSGRVGWPVRVRRLRGGLFAVSVPVALAVPPAEPVLLRWRGPGGGPAAFWRALGGVEA